MHVTEPSKFPIQAALFLQSFARSHGPVRMNGKMITSFTNFAKNKKISERTKIKLEYSIHEYANTGGDTATASANYCGPKTQIVTI